MVLGLGVQEKEYIWIPISRPIQKLTSSASKTEMGGMVDVISLLSAFLYPSLGLPFLFKNWESGSQWQTWMSYSLF